ncbi:MAG: DUF1624 domain-containing protein [Oscillospiraceae bacterium]|nr:DUF1624 domain-containing protein [Oscillospiraceae bacterium]
MSDTRRRLDILDGWRSLAVLLMLPWHLLWDLQSYGIVPDGTTTLWWVTLWRYVIVWSFLLVAGASCRFSRSSRKRGLRLLVVSLVISLVGWVIDTPIWFGILHLQCCCLLLYSLVEKHIEKIDPRLGLIFCLALFLICDHYITPLRVDNPWLFPLGFRTYAFYSADYYPILPWSFLFWAGCFLGEIMKGHLDVLSAVRLPRWVTWPGRHALLLYILHQPLFMLVLQLVM